MSEAPARSPMPSRAAWLSAASVAIVSLVWLGHDLGAPRTPYSDEGFYLTDARRFFRADGLLENPEHPPLGKWLMGLAIQLLGDDAIGWRAASLVAMVALLASLPLWLEPTGLVTARTPRWALLLPSSILLVDPLVLAMARIATLDAILVLFHVSAALALVASRNPAMLAQHARWLRIAAGVLGGLALGTKWTALTLVPIFLLAHVRLEGRHVRLDARACGELFAPFAASYLACFALPGATTFGPHAFPQVDGPLDASLPWPARVAVLHARMVGYHTYYFQGSQHSRWYEWLIARQALWLTAWSDGARVHVIAAIGSPIGWTVGALASLVALVRGVRSRRVALVLVPAFAIAQFAFWAIALRMTLVYYVSAIVPFYALALVGALAHLHEHATDPTSASRIAAAASAALLALGLGWLAYVRPLVRGEPLSAQQLEAYARGPAAPFLFHDELPLARALELVHGEGFQSARLAD